MTSEKTPIIRWDERYSAEEYIFGTAPNDFLVSVADRIPPGDVLCLADGEGRNGVFLADLGYRVTSIDSSQVGLAKAETLARKKGVQLDTRLADLTEYDLGENCWDCVVSIFFHLPPEIRRTLHRKVEKAIRPDGYLVLEAYTPEQLNFRTGGPPIVDRLMTLDALREDFPNLEFIHAEEKEREIQEGQGHAGRGAVVQLLARKPV